MTPELGIIEGYFGRSWTAAERLGVIRRLAPAGYGFFHYAPKADASLRREWRRPFTHEEARALAGLSAGCRAAGMRFGVGLTPYGAHDAFDAGARAALRDKLSAIAAAGIDDLVILFDDMAANASDAAERQAEITAFARAQISTGRLFLVPSFYSIDPILGRMFGPRPPRYWETLADQVDRDVVIYWTGEEVCAREIGPAHLSDIAALLRHPIALWDNYPVNDGPRGSAFINLRAFTGRPPGIARHIAAHAINPMLQPVLGCIPALTLPLLYARDDEYRYMAAFGEAARAVVGEPLAALLAEDLLALADIGLNSLGERTDALRERYDKVDHPAAREVVGWLDGLYRTSVEAVRTQ